MINAENYKPTEVTNSQEKSQTEKDDEQAQYYVDVIRSGEDIIDDTYIDHTLKYAIEKGGKLTASSLADCLARGILPSSENEQILSIVEQKGDDRALESISFAIANGRLVDDELKNAWQIIEEKGGIAVAENLVQNLNILRGDNLQKAVSFVMYKGSRQLREDLKERLEAGVSNDPNVPAILENINQL